MWLVIKGQMWNITSLVLYEKQSQLLAQTSATAALATIYKCFWQDASQSSPEKVFTEVELPILSQCDEGN